jgi:SAM-dependent methyltransferase
LTLTPTPPTPLHSPAAERNKQPILDALLQLLPAQGRALEIASGTGQHVAHFAAGMPGWDWLASDTDAQALASIRAWWPDGPAPLRLDLLRDADWPLPPSHAQRLDVIFSANMLHISPWATCAALMRGAALHLLPGGQLIVYGPFIVAGIETAPSNAAFDADLQRRNPAWGLRELADVQREAQHHGLQLTRQIAMPANNLLLRFTTKEPS